MKAIVWSKPQCVFCEKAKGLLKLECPIVLAITSFISSFLNFKSILEG